jgi:hypothetical protein
MNEQHTPGPWKAVELTPGGGTAVVRIGGIVVEGMYRGGENDPLTLADASLIAAAPDLLAALQGVLRVADRATVEFDAARAAIARALPQGATDA